MNKVEKACRALCKADGFDPDEHVSLGRVEAVEMGPGAVSTVPVTGPQWKRYIKEATRLVAVFDALGAEPLV